jgi:hypothetical protein
MIENIRHHIKQYNKYIDNGQYTNKSNTSNTVIVNNYKNA